MIIDFIRILHHQVLSVSQTQVYTNLEVSLESLREPNRNRAQRQRPRGLSMPPPVNGPLANMGSMADGMLVAVYLL